MAAGSAYIYGFVDKNWREGMTEEDAKAFVVKALSYAMARDASSGGLTTNNQLLLAYFLLAPTPLRSMRVTAMMEPSKVVPA